ncbi:hypothetical protein [Pleionea mediterranea]|uniref:Uncharacterized protein n=1 Tax=Pleionea mediterranea TaxID=523701 RepID=A0A316G334_9GAMM|nr:hypothetical protein [Pleionea mediterranea]PWK54210.1 hypothetical protein C8D97_10158 [Pleionea mediterranea]
MSTIIKHLEMSGEKGSVYLDGLESLEEQVCSAIREKDEDTLISLLNAPQNIICGLAPAEDDEPNEEPQEEPQEEPKETEKTA